jgi:glycosyltransferase involved in cell wall biosynthesis
VLLDLQGAQSVDHRDRGVARYVTELALAAERLGDRSPVEAYLLNPDLPLPGGIEPLVASGKLRFVDEPGVYRPGAHVHLASPIELSIPIDRLLPPAAREAGLRFTATVFDLIPLAMPATYLEDPGLRRRYLARLELLRAADGLVAISEFVAGDVVERLGVPAARVRAVPLVAAPSFRPDPSVARERVVLTTGGSDGRKNLEGLLDAWARVPAPARAGWRLVVAGSLPPLFRNHLEVMADRLGARDSFECLGFISEDDLVRWNQRAGLVVFPSLAEGYGLPVMEAMACGTPVIAGDNTSIVELLPPAARFDASSPAAMAEAIARALSDPPAPPARSTRTWDDVAAETLSFCEGLVPSEGTRPSQNAGGGRGSRRRVAFVSPLPPQPGGVAEYSAKLLDALRARPHDVTVDAFVDGPPHHRDDVLAAGAGARPLAALDRVEALQGRYDDVVVALGNSEFHTGALAWVATHPGRATVLAHDVRLTTLHRFAPWQHPEGAPGGFHATLRRVYDGRLPPTLGERGELTADEAERWGVLLARDVIARSRRFLATSVFAAELARLDARPEHRDRIGVVPFAVGPAAGVAPAPDRDPLVVSFGVLNRTKQGRRLVEAFAAAAPSGRARLAFVGPAGADDRADVLAAASAAGVAARVEVTGAVDDTTYRRWLARAWVAVQLRATTNGESSAAVGDALAASIPTIVTGIGANRALPDAAVVKVGPDVGAGVLADELGSLLGDDARRRSMAAAARAHAASATFAAAAEALLAALS